MHQQEIEKAARAGDVELCRKLLKRTRGTDPNAGVRLSAFQQLCKEGEVAACETLIKAGVDIMAKEFLKTPLMTAAQYGQTDVCKVLLAAGADPNWRSIMKMDALSLACSGGNRPLAELLLQAGADPDVLNDVGQTALMAAANCGDADMCRVLINGGANVNLVDKKGSSALEYALFHDKCEAFVALSKAGADTVFRSKLGKDFTPFQLAVRYGSVSIVERMLSSGSEDLGQRAASGRTMMQLAGTNQAMKDLLHSAKTTLVIKNALDAKENAGQPRRVVASGVVL